MGKTGKNSNEPKDIYYRLAMQQGWRDRSAFKLLHVDDHFKICKDVSRAVDLYAIPGSWSQVLAKRIRAENAKIVAVDRQGMEPVEGVYQIQGQMTDQSTATEIISLFEGDKAELVVCDAKPPGTGMVDMDEYMEHQFLLAGLNITTHILKNGGTFVAKIFRGKEVASIYAQLTLFFPSVVVTKPPCCQYSSTEAFVVCRGYNPPPGFVPSMESPLMEGGYSGDYLRSHGITSAHVPFISLADLTSYYADTYEEQPGQAGHSSHNTEPSPPQLPFAEEESSSDEEGFDLNNRDDVDNINDLMIEIDIGFDSSSSEER